MGLSVSSFQSCAKSMHESRLHDLGIRKEINKVHFKDRVLEMCTHIDMDFLVVRRCKSLKVPHLINKTTPTYR